MKKTYTSPNLAEYGRIADCTFTTPNGNVKGGAPDYALDKFGEHSHPAETTTGGS